MSVKKSRIVDKSSDFGSKGYNQRLAATTLGTGYHNRGTLLRNLVLIVARWGQGLSPELDPAGEE